MKLSLNLAALAVAQVAFGATTGPQFKNGQPNNGAGKGGPLLGMHTIQLAAGQSQPAS